MNLEILKEVAIYIPVVAAFAEVVKRAVKVKSGLMPLVSVLVGVGMAYFLSVSVLVGGIMGLAASGLYDFKSVVGR